MLRLSSSSLASTTMLPRPPSPNPPYSTPYATATHNPGISANYDRKQKQRSIMGITAGAEDVKYQAKYKELKKKVKEIESVSHYAAMTPRIQPSPCGWFLLSVLAGQ